MENGRFLAVKLNFEAIESWLETERDQLPLWVPVCLGVGIVAWFVIGNNSGAGLFMALCLATAFAGFSVGIERRAGRALIWLAMLAAIGCGLIWAKSEWVAAEKLEKPGVVAFFGEVQKIELLPARQITRLTLLTGGKQQLPLKIRVNVKKELDPDNISIGDVVSLRARLMPPAGPAVPGAYDFAQRAWFAGLGATGSALGPVKIFEKSGQREYLADFRRRLAAHVQSRMTGGAGAIGATLATGDRGAIDERDAEAMRRSGLAHLLSISGLHVTAIVGGVFLLIIKLAALSPTLALRWRLPLVAAAFGAIAGLSYTLMTGAQVPTIRACVAALLILAGLAIGRDAITLRLVAAGALFVLVFWPEAIMGPSFQLSFAAVTAIVALHETKFAKTWFSRRDESWFRKMGRVIFGLFVTGLVVEIVLAPIALFHFHKAGLYGAFANIIAIPLTTFVIMPLEALALLFDLLGLGAPFWALCQLALDMLLGLAHQVSSTPGSVAMLPTMSRPAFGLIIIGGLWFLLWKNNARFLGILPLCTGIILMISTPTPDILVTGDGRHVALRDENGSFAFLRPRAGDYVRSVLGESAGYDGEIGALEDWSSARCSKDICVVRITQNNRAWDILLTRSNYYVPVMELAAACKRVDIVISARWLPYDCKPKWLKADRNLLEQTGGLSIMLSNQSVKTVSDRSKNHKWSVLGKNVQRSAKARKFKKTDTGARTEIRKSD